MAEYAYVTDGACSESEIISKEIIICKVRIMNVCSFCTVNTSTRPLAQTKSVS